MWECRVQGCGSKTQGCFMIMLVIAIGLCLSDYRLLSGTSMPFWSGKDYLQSSGIKGLYISCQQLHMDCRRSTMYHLWLTWSRALCSRGKSVLRDRSIVLICSCLKIASDRPDLHSGIEGGAVAEPMIDMYVLLSLSKLVFVIYTQLRVRLLSTIIDNNRVVQIPGFCALFFSRFLFSLIDSW